MKPSSRHLLVIAAGCLVLCSPLLAQVQLSKTVRAAQDSFIEGYVRRDTTCKPLDPPQLVIEQPPEHGIVCYKLADVLTQKPIGNNYTQCLGKKISGIHVRYLARGGYTGPDHVLYIVVFPDVRHKVEVNLNVLPAKPNSSVNVPADISEPADEKPQLSGPMPSCTVLVS